MITRSKQAWPITPAQKGIWLGQQLAGKSSRYNTAEYVVIEGPLDRALFIQQIKTVFENATGLNVAFDQEGATHQVCQQQCQVEYVDFTISKQAMDAARQWMNNELNLHSDISRGHLYTVALLKLAAVKWILFVKIHHIASDGYSYALLFNKIFARYEKGLQGKPSDSEPLFGDYEKAIADSLSVETSEQNQQSQCYWANQISQLKHPVTFSNYDAEVSDTFIRYQADFSEQTYIGLINLAKRLRVNWTDILLAAVARLLCIKTARTQISLGLPVMDRMGTAAANVPLMCMNIVPLVLHFQANQTFAEMVKVVAKQMAKDRPFRRYRYEALRAQARQSQPTANGAIWGPVVNIMPFVRKASLGDCRLSYHNLSAGPVDDISLGFTLNADKRLHLQMDANPQRYQLADLQTLATELQTVIENCPQQFQQRLMYQKHAFSWLASDTFTAQINSHSESSGLSLWEKIKATSLLAGSHNAIEYNGHILSYTALVKQVMAFADQLTEMGLLSGDRCALILPRSPQAIIACLACIKLKIAFVFIDITAPLSRNRRLLKDCRANLQLVSQPADLESYSDLGMTGLLDTDYSVTLTDNSMNFKGSNRQGEKPHCERDEAYLIYTSGSTGQPKGVAIGRRAMTDFVESAIRVYTILPTDRVLQFAPLHFDACIEEIFTALCTGATLVLRNEQVLDSMETFCHLCRDWAISVLDLPTAFWHEWVSALVHQRLALPPTLRTVIIGGEAANRDSLSQWLGYLQRPVHLFNSYGPTEATVVATVEPLHDYNDSDITIALGQPLPGRALMIVDDQLAIVPKDESGELLLLGDGLANGYIGLPEATTRAFCQVSLPWLSTPVRAYRTGDRACLTNDNRLLYQGRIDNEFKVSGHRIAPAEIETALIKLPGIEQAIVTTCKRGQSTQIAAHIQGEEAQALYPDAVAIRKALTDLLPVVMLPKWVKHYSQFPINASGKVDRRCLAELVTSTVATIIPDDEFKVIRQLWTELLGEKDFSPNDDFFAHGGESIQVIQLANRLSQITGKTITGALLFQNSTLESMTQAVLDTDTASKNANNAPGASQATTMQKTKGQKVNTQKDKVLDDCRQFEYEIGKVIPISGLASKNETLKNVILTGATGFVGINLMIALLKHSKAKIQCLIRAEDAQQARVKLMAACRQFAIALDGISQDQIDKRVTCFPADLQQSDLGLTLERRANIFSPASCIIHAAAITSVTRDYSSLRAVNTLATGELLKLARAYHLRFCYIATVAVSPPKASGRLLTESFVNFHQALSDGYQQSKWAGERFVQAAKCVGVDARVYRLGRVTGSLSSGYVNPKDLVWQILTQGLDQGILPDLAIQEPWTPVDEVAAFIVSNQMYNDSPAIFNVVPKHRVALSNIIQWLKKSGWQGEVLSVEQWCQRLSDLEEASAFRRDKEPSAFRGKEPSDHGYKNISALPLLTFFEQKKQAKDNGLTLEMADIDAAVFQQQLVRQNQLLSDIGCQEFKQYLQYAEQQLGLNSFVTESKDSALSNNEMLEVTRV